MTGDSGWISLAYKDWRPIHLDQEKTPLVICVHGLTRNSCDFDYVAAQLSGKDKFRVLSLDVPGRGYSSSLAKDTEYSYPTYVRIVREWLSVVVTEIFGDNEPTIYWIGTSMGGLIGTMLNAAVEFPLISRLVLNDIGAFISGESLERLKRYCGTPPTFTSLSDANTYIRSIYSPFEPLSDEQWDFLVRSSVESDKSTNKLVMRYDPRITIQLMMSDCADMDIFDSVWEKVHKNTKILLLRGETSDILLPETVDKMKKTGPGLDSVETFAIVGHAPMLLSDEQTEPIRNFFRE